MFHPGMKGFHYAKSPKPKVFSLPRGRRTLAERKYQELVEILDAEFSFNVRARAVIEGNGIARCVTCGKPGGMVDFDCGHYITRAVPKTRYLRVNTGPQCPKCNRFMNGMAHMFRAYLVKTYGAAEIEKLEYIAQDTGWRDSHEGLISKILDLREENKDLRKRLKALDGRPQPVFDKALFASRELRKRGRY